MRHVLTLHALLFMLVACHRSTVPPHANSLASRPAAESASAPASAPASVDVRNLVKAYRRLRLMTPVPVNMNGWLISVCAPWGREAMKEAEARSGPHALSALNIYMNEAAAKAFMSKQPEYPVGAVIVKEKHPESPELGGMIKRESGFDPDGADWEYFYADRNQHIDSGRLAKCRDCHRAARQTGWVYGDWDRQPLPSTMPIEPSTRLFE